MTTSNEVEILIPNNNESQVCDQPRCVKTRDERDQLLASIRDLTHAQLIARDIELGLRAELMQAKIDLEHTRARGAHDLAQTRLSTTWRLGRMVMIPVATAKKLLRRLKK